MSDDAITTKAELLAAIDQKWQLLTAALERLAPAAFTAHQDDHGWTVKDHLVHIAAWERSVVYLLSGRPRHAGLGVAELLYLLGDEDAINDAIMTAHRDVALDAALAELRTVHAATLAALAPLDDAALHLRYRHYLPNEPGEGDGPPAITIVYGNTANHYAEHLPWIETLAAGVG